MSNVAIFVAHEGCPQQCSFCNQHIIAGQEQRVSAAQVRCTLEKALENPSHRHNQIAFFGGSFTAIERTYMCELLEATVPFREAFAGIRISTRPDAIDREVLQLLASYGVKAIELGAQSMDDRVLRLNRRGHTAADVERASRLISEEGFELGLQMMTGLYGDTTEKCIESAKKIINLKPDTVRIYPTVVLKGTYLAKLYLEEKYHPLNADDSAELCAKLVPMFENAGIRIIRLGLHSSEDIKRNMLAGGFHDSFGELVKSRLLVEKILAYPPGDYQVFVNERSISKLKGNKKSNIYLLMERGYNIKIIKDNSLEVDELRIK